MKLTQDHIVYLVGLHIYTSILRSVPFMTPKSSLPSPQGSPWSESTLLNKLCFVLLKI